MAHNERRPRSHPDVRHRSQIPLPAVEEVEPRLLDVRSPSVLAPRQRERRDPPPPHRVIRRRQRRLTRPGILAILVRLGWRRVPSLAERQKVLSREGVWGMAPRHVSPPALITRLEVRPAAVMRPRLAEGCPRVQAPSPPPLPHPRGAPVRERCSVLALGDGATREARRQKTEVVRARAGLGWAGRMMGRVEAFRHRPLWQLSTADAAAHATRVAAESLAALPVGGRLVVDLGVFSVLWCEDCTDPQQGCVTRMREKTADRTVPELRGGPSSRDASMPRGHYRSTPCQHPLRMVSVRWQGTW